MIVPVTALALALLPLLLGGRGGRLAVLRLRGTEVVAAALVLQSLAVAVLDGPRRLLVAAHVGSYVVAAVFVWLNRRVPGLVLLGAGALSNGVTIAVNGGTLPASAHALARAGMSWDAAGFTNSGLVENPRMAFLGDVFAVPAGWPLANVFSVGDVLVVLGAGWASWRVCGTRWTQPWSPRDAGHARGRHVAGLLDSVLDVVAPPRRRVPARRVRGGRTAWSSPTAWTGPASAWGAGTTFGPSAAGPAPRILET